MGMILISHLVPQEAALVLQLLFVNVDQALQHVGLKKLGAHLEVDNLEELLNSKERKICPYYYTQQKQAALILQL